jgi:NitT/TauT family transport system substrate-binding protein
VKYNRSHSHRPGGHRRLRHVAAVVGLAASLALGRPATAEDALPLSFSHLPILSYSNAIVAARKDFFKEAGLNVSRKVIGASDVIRSALASGDLDVAAVSADTLIRAHAAGFNWKLLFPGNNYDPSEPDAVIAARSDLHITSPKQLEGRTLAISFGTIAEVGAKVWLRAAGADLSKVKFVEVPFPQQLGAFQSKSIDAAHMVQPYMTIGRQRKLIDFIGNDLDTVGGRFVVAGYVATADWIAKNPEKAKRFVAALEKATTFIKEHPDQALPLIAQEGKLDTAVVAEYFPREYFIWNTVEPEELQRTIDFLAKEKFIDKAFSYKEIVSNYVKIGKH